MIIFAIKYNKVYTKFEAFIVNGYGKGGCLRGIEVFHKWLLDFF